METADLRGSWWRWTPPPDLWPRPLSAGPPAMRHNP